MGTGRKPLVILKGELKTPPLADESRREIGRLLGLLQDGESIGMPKSRPMPSIGPGCHELRVRDARHNWRVLYRIDADAIVVVDVFPKATAKTPRPVIVSCKARLAEYDLG
jgi:phage-related protein